MENRQKMLFDFAMEHTQDGRQEAMKAALEENLRPPQEGKFDPDALKRGIEVITSMLKPEAVEEFHKMMNPFGDMENSSEPPVIKNMLAQPNRYKWRDNTPAVSEEEMRKAQAYADKAHDMECDCWNHCPLFGDCKACIVFHLYMGQFPTCQRSLLGDLEEHYIVFSRDMEYRAQA
ncbi:MAG: hypothetical protein JW712_09625 [Dehalococcoidales bacterium]|nr:hypothetical protein [Dehalococcoidales bacterium]